MIAHLLAAALTCEAETMVWIEEPFSISMPCAAAAEWNRLPEPRAGEDAADEPLAIVPNPFRTMRGRIDALRRENGRWIWAATFEFPGQLATAASLSDMALLVRFDDDTRFLWSERAADAPIEFAAFRTIAITGAEGDEELFAFFTGKPHALRAESGRARFRMAPALPGIVCATRADGSSRCNGIDPGADNVALGGTVRGDVRLFRAESPTAINWSLLGVGNSAVRPRELVPHVLVAGEWNALLLQPGDWHEAAVDASTSFHATSRFAGSTLARLPSHTELIFHDRSSLAIRPFVADSEQPLRDDSALLLVFSSEPLAVTAIPAATALPSEDGVFPIPDLPPGSYELQLLSAHTAAERIPATLFAGTVDVRFPRGPAVSGRLYAPDHLARNEPATVRVGPLIDFKEGVPSELIERTRFATVADDGTFNLVLSASGRYRLLATRGSASGYRDFEIDSPPDDIDLGVIPLAEGSRLFGFVERCEGEAVALPVPNPKNDTIGLAALKRAPIIDGSFVLEGLHAGTWSILFLCEGHPVPARPSRFEAPREGVIILEFSLTEAGAEEAAPPREGTRDHARFVARPALAPPGCT